MSLILCLYETFVTFVSRQEGIYGFWAHAQKRHTWFICLAVTKCANPGLKGPWHSIKVYLQLAWSFCPLLFWTLRPNKKHVKQYHYINQSWAYHYSIITCWLGLVCCMVGNKFDKAVPWSCPACQNAIQGRSLLCKNLRKHEVSDIQPWPKRCSYILYNYITMYIHVYGIVCILQY